jgi:hypothetical protein
MRTAVLVFIVAGWLLAQSPTPLRLAADAPTNERLGKIEGTLSAVETQLSTVQAQGNDNSKVQTDMQRQLADLSAKMNLVLWVGAAVGVLLLGAAWKSLERRGTVTSSPAYTTFGQWEMEVLARPVVEEIRRDEEVRQTPKSR